MRRDTELVGKPFCPLAGLPRRIGKASQFPPERAIPARPAVAGDKITILNSGPKCTESHPLIDSRLGAKPFDGFAKITRLEWSEISKPPAEAGA